MIKIFLVLLIFIFSSILTNCSKSNTEPELKDISIVDHFGQLKINGKYIVDQNDNVVVLRGMSLFWSQWGGVYYNEETIRWLRDDWKCTIIRAAIGVENGGYLENKQQELLKLYNVIDTSIELGIYVIIDWHDHQAENHVNDALEFFNTVSNKYGSYPNIIYEIYNEPLQVSWTDVIKPYADTVVPQIRNNDPDNIIVVGTPNWSQDVDDVIGNRVNDDNVAYSLHFYSSSHGQNLRDKANIAISANIPLLVTEWGLTESSGTGNIDMIEVIKWIDFLQQNNLSWCNWSIINKDETSAALLPSNTELFGWNENELTQSGNFIRDHLISMNSNIFDLISSN